MAVLIATAFPLCAWAQTEAPADATQEDVMTEPETDLPETPMDEADSDEPVDPASPDAPGDAADDVITEDQDVEPGEPDGDTAMEDAGQADMISDSSERKLTRADVADLDCDQLWIARNEIFDRNGYCFRSERGKSYFDNADCTSDSQDILSSLEWENVRLIQEVEREQQCN